MAARPPPNRHPLATESPPDAHGAVAQRPPPPAPTPRPAPSPRCASTARRPGRGTPRRPGSAAAPPCRRATGPSTRLTVASAVAPPGLELLGQPVEHDEPLRARRRDRHQPPVPHEGPQHLGVLGGHVVGHRLEAGARPTRQRPGPPSAKAEPSRWSVPSPPRSTSPAATSRVRALPARGTSRPVAATTSSSEAAPRMRAAATARRSSSASSPARAAADSTRLVAQYPSSGSTGPISSSPRAKRRTFSVIRVGQQGLGHLGRVGDVGRDDAVRQRPERVARRAAARDR